VGDNLVKVLIRVHLDVLCDMTDNLQPNCSLCSSGSIVSDYGLDSGAIEVRSPTGADFSSSPYVQTGCGAHPASYPMGTGGSFAGGKALPGRDTDHSPPSSAEVKNEYELYLLSPTCFHGM
jgi:hypothetical protein